MGVLVLSLSSGQLGVSARYLEDFSTICSLYVQLLRAPVVHFLYLQVPNRSHSYWPR